MNRASFEQKNRVGCYEENTRFQMIKIGVSLEKCDVGYFCPTDVSEVLNKLKKAHFG